MGLAWCRHGVAVVLAIGSLACEGDVESLDGSPEDASAGMFCEPFSDSGVRVGAGLVSGEPTACNQCICSGSGNSCPPEGCSFSCTAVACLPSFGPPARTPCTSSAECGDGAPTYNICVYNLGCEAPSGYCIAIQSTCPTAQATPADAGAESRYCGCDGVTYEGPCPVVPYRHAGPCQI